MNNSDQNRVRVLFICMGNICRSPAAEGVFQHYVQQAGFSDRIEIDSAGTINYHQGEPADGRMQAAATRRGYTLSSRARQIQVADIKTFDLIVAMDHDNLQNLEHMAHGPQPHIRMLGSFLDGAESNKAAKPVPDPYYGGGDGFERVLDMLEAACPALLEYCQTLFDKS